MNLTPIIGMIISITSLCITTFLIPWIRTKISIEKNKKVREEVNIAVHAAEQIYKNVEKSGILKKTHVIKSLAEKGYIIDIEAVSDDMNNLIESAVYELTK